MKENPIRPSETSAAIAELARIQLAGERRLQRLERLFRWNLVLLLSTLLLAAFALTQFFGAASAQPGWPHATPQLMPEPQPIEPPVAAPAPESPMPDPRAGVEEPRAGVAGVEPEQMDPFHAITAVLHDLHGVLHESKEALAVLPEMVEEMRQMRGDVGRIAATMDSMDGKMDGVPVMAEEMHRLNVNIDIMTTSIDSTMGRMGRMMPYVW
ncbi:MAG: hypothetical protein EA347_10705 [Thioalkalivibrio sp.]|nr:MAG: hypothetical protein EA347_10705 [Thioalkalivibrio sp.]